MKNDRSEIAENPSPLVGLSGETTLALESINLITCVIQRNHGHTVVESYAGNSINVPSLPQVVNPLRNRDDLGKLEGITSLLCRRNKTKKSDSETIPRKKLASDQKAQEQDSAELFWQLRKAEILEEKREPTCKPVVSVFLDEAFPERCIEIGANLHEPLRTKLIACLRKNLHAFASAAEDMPGIDIKITCHELNIDPTFKPVKQKRQKLGPERATAVNDEVEKLLKVGSITEVRYPDWLANPVVVKKKNGKWRVCGKRTFILHGCFLGLQSNYDEP
ncbi:PREDICTED: uncharacterized protein LOC106314892 [Brassica oleracea var. oleracea]|uniref:uncharacterized protein LOC106314892 n=1 Tax=Brassica oleracea var. oleracea TaxID=109376 RepID=UPI0006A72E39|nr:PREDICTED: uncharacterized protein LOC106314892 [Brassica oleracea var. oleracea]